MKNRFVRILENDDWIIDYCKETNRYRVSYFEDFHFVDDICFDAYEDKEIDDRIEKIIDKSESIEKMLIKRDYSEKLKKNFDADARC